LATLYDSKSLVKRAVRGGAATWCFSIPEKRLTVIVLTNLQGALPQRLAADIIALYEPSVAKQASH
jgi:CubicO group peptidase (beta-lactamase class C family)